MKWEAWGDYARRCVQHKLSISKAKVKDDWIYTLWKIRKYEWVQDDLIGNFKTFEAAKKAAEDLVDEQSGKANKL